MNGGFHSISFREAKLVANLVEQNTNASPRLQRKAGVVIRKIYRKNLLNTYLLNDVGTANKNRLILNTIKDLKNGDPDLIYNPKSYFFKCFVEGGKEARMVLAGDVDEIVIQKLLSQKKLLL